MFITSAETDTRKQVEDRDFATTPTLHTKSPHGNARVALEATNTKNTCEILLSYKYTLGSCLTRFKIMT